MTRMHEIDIVIDTKDVPAINKKLNQRIPCKFTFDGIVLDNVGVKQKGGPFQAVRTLKNKPSLSVKFDEFVVGQALSGLRKLVLNHGAQDRALLGEHLGYEMYRRTKIPGPRTAYATVTINGFTEGIYVVKEAVGTQFLARHYGKRCDQGNLYESGGSDFADSPKALDLNDEIAESRKRDDLIAAANVVKNAPDVTFEAQVSGKINLDNFITTYAIDAVILHLDDAAYHSNNFYMYNHPADNRFMFLPHGMDQTFSGFLHVVKEDVGPFALPPASVPRDIFSGARLTRRIRAIPALDARFRAEVARIARDVWNIGGAPIAAAGTHRRGGRRHSDSHHQGKQPDGRRPRSF